MHWQKHSTDYLKILIAYQQHIINLQWKHENALGESGTADENPQFFFMVTNTTINWKESKSLIKNNRKWRENNGDTFSSGWWEESDTIHYVKEKESLKQKLPMELHLNVMWKGSWQNLQSHGWDNSGIKDQVLF